MSLNSISAWWSNFCCRNQCSAFPLAFFATNYFPSLDVLSNSAFVRSGRSLSWSLNFASAFSPSIGLFRWWYLAGSFWALQFIPSAVWFPFDMFFRSYRIISSEPLGQSILFCWERRPIVILCVILRSVWFCFHRRS
jgi:hypothetical protein